ncbi:MAG: hypothetical protein ACK4IS_09450 [Erythrobacter sp.]
MICPEDEVVEVELSMMILMPPLLLPEVVPSDDVPPVEVRPEVPPEVEVVVETETSPEDEPPPPKKPPKKPPTPPKPRPPPKPPKPPPKPPPPPPPWIGDKGGRGAGMKATCAIGGHSLGST